MNRVYKYSIPNVDWLEWNDVHMPVGAQILKADYQRADGGLKVWAIIDDDVLAKEERRFVVIGTGNRLSPVPGMEYKHVATFFREPNGEHVFHLFELVSK